MKYDQVKNILNQSDFPDGEFEAIRQYAAAESSFRKKIIKAQDKDTEVHLCAAIEIQRHWRGYLGRCNVFGVRQPIISKIAIYSESISCADRLKDAEYEEEPELVAVPPAPVPTSIVSQPSKHRTRSKQVKKKSMALRKLEQQYRQYLKEKKEEKAPSETVFKFHGFCAAYIQKWWRTILVNKDTMGEVIEEEVEYEEEEYEETEEEEEEEEEEEVEVEVEVEPSIGKLPMDAQSQPEVQKKVEKKIVKVKKPKEKKEKVKVKKTRIVKKVKVVQKKPENVKQVVFAALKGLKDQKEKQVLSHNDAASMIQRAWRRHIDMQVYKYYRDLINFRTQGDPSMMLRCINPNESRLLDPATGVHVRFRLAGDRFPPNIYYKIFTHRPIVDMCANSPKDYTKGSSKQPVAFDKNNRARQQQMANTSDKTGWYQRYENNGWRLVSDRLIHHIMSDPITWETSRKKYEFHHDKLQRKQDIEKRKKQKKIDWMKKMYKEGMLKARSHDEETRRLIEGAATGMVATIDNIGPEALEEWEVDELLDWTTGLNFEDYWIGWKDLATSAYSEHKTEERMKVTDSDPYELTLSTCPSRLHSTRQSQNTPISVIK